MNKPGFRRCLLLGCFFTALLVPAHGRAADDLTATLQRGLFEEEANHNLSAAIKAYQSVVNATDGQRKLAATALFRLAECHRKLGQTNDAAVYYQRVVREYPDQPRLVEFSQQQLGATAGIGVAARRDRDRMLEGEWIQAQSEAVRTRTLYHELTNLTRVELRKAIATVYPSELISQLQRDRSSGEQQLVALTNQFGLSSPEVKKMQSSLRAIDVQMEEALDGVLAGIRLRLVADEKRVAELKRELDQMRQPEPLSVVATGVSPLSYQWRRDGKGTNTGEANVTPAAREGEEAQIQTIQAMLRDSPDLINARTHFSSALSGNPVTGLTLLQKAALEGRLKVAEFLLAHGADVNALSGSNPASPGPTALALAARAGNRSMVELLLAKGASPHVGSAFTPLHEAASQGFKSVVEVLLDAGSDVNSQSYSKRTPLHEAAGRGYPGVALTLIARGADVNAVYTDTSAGFQMENTSRRINLGGTALHQAAEGGDKAMTELLLTNKANPNLRTTHGFMPLHAAVYRGFVPVVAALIKGGANVNAHAADPSGYGVNTRRVTPLSFAIQLGRLEMVQFLLEQGADPNLRYDSWSGNTGLTALHQVLYDRPKDFMSMIELLFRHKANPNLTNDYGMVPLFSAMRAGDQPVLELLLKNGAEPNALDREGRGALHVYEPHYPIFEMLLTHRADPNLRDKQGATPLHRQAERARQPLRPPGPPPPSFGAPGPARIELDTPTGLAGLLIKHGADPNLRNNSGQTPLNYFGVPASAASTEGNAFIALLREHGAKDEMLEPAADLPSIRVWRKGATPRVVFVKDTDGRNRYSLFETILNFYRLTKYPPPRIDSHVDSAQALRPTGTPFPGQPLSEIPARAIPARAIRQIGAPEVPIDPRPSRVLWGGDNFKPAEALPFPDFTRVRVHRLAEAGKPEKRILDFNLLDAEREFDCAKNTWLEFGDLVEVPEREFRLDEQKVGLTEAQDASLLRCIPIRVKFIVRGETAEVSILPVFYLCRVHSVFQMPQVRNVLRSSSNLARVTLRRMDPVTGAPVEFIINGTWEATSKIAPEDDLVLRDGDVLEVPDK